MHLQDQGSWRIVQQCTGSSSSSSSSRTARVRVRAAPSPPLASDLRVNAPHSFAHCRYCPPHLSSSLHRPMRALSLLCSLWPSSLLPLWPTSCAHATATGPCLRRYMHDTEALLRSLLDWQWLTGRRTAQAVLQCAHCQPCLEPAADQIIYRALTLPAPYGCVAAGWQTKRQSPPPLRLHAWKRRHRCIRSAGDFVLAEQSDALVRKADVRISASVRWVCAATRVQKSGNAGALAARPCQQVHSACICESPRMRHGTTVYSFNLSATLCKLASSSLPYPSFLCCMHNALCCV
jgi:hypothetical protein